MAKDPYRYFRVEARELLDGLTQGLLDLEKGAHSKELLTRLLRQAHTLKGAARVVKLTKLSEQTHALEELLAPYREGQQPVPAERLAEMLDLLDRFAAGLAGLHEPGPAAEPAAAPAERPRGRAAAEETFETVRVDIEELDRLLQGLAELGINLASLQRAGARVTRARGLAERLAAQLRAPAERAGGGRSGPERAVLAAEELREALAQLQENLAGDAELARSELVQARERAQQLRLAPVGHVFTNLERAARDAGAALGKAVVFEATGGATRLDAHVLASLQGALLQLVRNAVAHGIEAPAARQAKGKPPAGRIRVAVAQRGNRVSIRCSDDGAGIDLAAVREAAVEAGAVEAERAPALSLDEVVQLLLRGGVTTALQSTEVSGRGIGLEVVRAAVADLKGEVAVETEPGAGTTVELRVPIQLVSLAALRVEVEGRVAALPLSAVRKTVRLEREQLMHAAEKIELVFEGQSVPYAPLGALLGAPGGVEPRAALLVEAPAGVAALGVDRLLGAATVVVRALPEFVGADAVVAGAALDAEGRPELVLDAPALVEAARAGRAAAPRPAAAAPPPILVIDDSLTTRMLEQSILEAAGFEVDLAASAEEGLERARQRAYGLFIVDVEMPGMSGFEFVELVRSSADLRHVPCMLVTSRSSREDLQRGKDAGARAYIVKSEFDQGYLLRTIRELIG